MTTKKTFGLGSVLIVLLFGVFGFLTPTAIQAEDQPKSGQEITIVGEIRSLSQSEPSEQPKSTGQTDQSGTLGQDQVSPNRSGEEQSSPDPSSVGQDQVGQDQVSPNRSGEEQSSSAPSTLGQDQVGQDQVSPNRLGQEDSNMPSSNQEQSATVEIAEKSNWILFETVKKVYPIANEGKGQELAGHIGCKVKATGMLETDVDGKEVFHVSSYEIIEASKEHESQDQVKESPDSSEDTQDIPAQDEEVTPSNPDTPR